MTIAKSRLAQIKSVMLVSSGNFLEMYDFQVFAFYATYIAATFFPAANEMSSLLATLMAFGAGFLARPIGGLLLGAYVDRHGRRKGMILSMALMGVGTLGMALTPSYAQIGILAPVLIVICRLVQGLAAGVEVGNASVYLAEIAPPEKKGFYVAWQSASQQVAVMFAALLGVALNAHFGKVAMTEFGWRIPFILGGLLIPLLVVARRSLEETPAFLAQEKPPHMAAVIASCFGNMRLVLLGAMMAIMTTVFYYMITSYTPTYGSKVLNLSIQASMITTLCVGLANFILLPTMGALSDRIGRKPLLITCAVLGLVTPWFVLSWLVQAPSFGRLMGVELWLAFLFATYNGAMVVFLTEVIPVHLRTTGFSLAYSIATGFFGGFTPAISTALIQYARGHNYAHADAAPAIWLSLAAAVALTAVLILKETRQSSRKR